MGVGSATAQFLMEAAERGVRFDRTATIGRQTLFVAPREVERLIARHRLGLASGRDPAVRRRLRDEPGLLDPMLAVLGATEVTSIDASAYERATEARVPIVMTLLDYGLLCPTLKLYDVDDQLCMRQEVGDQRARCCAMAPRTDRHLVRMTLLYEAVRAAAALGPLEGHLRTAWRKALAVRGRR